uniref:Jacalin-type lectin domain-containing protein n=1 Tax=Lotus japonicus TaxID=34305 RepID=I3SUW8_LOTJA|nr:unknown [Lotus japonicus]
MGGGNGGRPWDDGVFSGIKQIYLTKAPEGICSIQIEYDRNKQSVWSVKHGGNGGNILHRIKLEYPHEVLTCISGYYRSITMDEHPIIIKSLTFYTSRGKYGPFGDEVGNFSLQPQQRVRWLVFMGGVACTWMQLGSICNTGWEVRELQSHPYSSYFDL